MHILENDISMRISILLLSELNAFKLDTFLSFDTLISIKKKVNL